MKCKKALYINMKIFMKKKSLYQKIYNKLTLFKAMQINKLKNMNTCKEKDKIQTKKRVKQKTLKCLMNYTNKCKDFAKI